MNLTTPALLFPAISLLFLSYTNRFLTLAQLIRQLTKDARYEHREMTLAQIVGLKKRIKLIKVMQIFAVSSFLGCAGAMFVLFVENVILGEIIFGISLILLLVSLFFSLWEIMISTNALNIELETVPMKKK